MAPSLCWNVIWGPRDICRSDAAMSGDTWGELCVVTKVWEPGWWRCLQDNSNAGGSGGDAWQE